MIIDPQKSRDDTWTETSRRCHSSSDREDCDNNAGNDFGVEKNAKRYQNSNLQNPEYFSSRWREILFVISCMISQLLNQAASTQTNPLFNAISDEFKSSSSKQTWLMASFPLVSGSFILVSGKFGDIYGLKKTLLGGYVVATIWSLICGFSSYTSSVDFFIVARAFQGLGIAFVLPNIMGLVGTIYVPNTKVKNMVISMIGACAPIGATFGVLFSGLIGTKTKNWAWTFYAYAVLAFVNGVIAWWVIPDNVPINSHNFKMDWVGSALGVTGLILLNFAWNQGPIEGWGTSYVIALLVISLFILLAFFVYEVRFAKEPLIPRAAMFNRRLLMILSSIFFGWGSFGIWTFYYMCFVLNLRHYTPLWAGGTYFMFVIWGIIAALTVGKTIHRMHPSILLFFSMVAFDCGCIMLAVTPVHQTYFRITMGTMIILSFGMDFSFPAASITLSDELPSEHQGMAGSLVSTMINYSMSLCLGIGGTAERQINKSGNDLLKGYRAALYVGIGLASIGVFISGTFMLENIYQARRKNMLATKLENHLEKDA
ncbi:LAMI_0G01376g1_1 [Lachancea mirantina]|uniref:LAMI_0G01376g1_1 n=1 Tax=Lachancea mirantina TaxID=1230905 RepID=A0A1G4K7I1_9SACH|nr:LAMI_0G01376g1_1 [Lachancea mirantina]